MVLRVWIVRQLSASEYTALDREQWFCATPRMGNGALDFSLPTTPKHGVGLSHTFFQLAMFVSLYLRVLCVSSSLRVIIIILCVCSV